MTYTITTTRMSVEVATLEEAREAVAGLVKGRRWISDVSAYEEAVETADALAAEGGTIGPLPDGTIIKVTRS